MFYSSLLRLSARSLLLLLLLLLLVLLLVSSLLLCLLLLYLLLLLWLLLLLSLLSLLPFFFFFLLLLLHPVSITRFPLTRFSPGAGLLRHPFVHRWWRNIFQGLGPKRRESSNGDRVYTGLLSLLFLLSLLSLLPLFFFFFFLLVLPQIYSQKRGYCKGAIQEEVK